MMRQNHKLIYGFFVVLGVALLLVSYIAHNVLNLPLLGATLNNLGTVVVSLALVDVLWGIVGGEPLAEQIVELKKFNTLYTQAERSGLINLYPDASNSDYNPNWLELISRALREKVY